nr:hypothetical protein [Tanacetum cinerariifolium]
MVFCTTLSKKVESLEVDLKQTKQIYGTAYTKLIKKGRKISAIDQDPAISLVQHDIEIQGRNKHDVEINTAEPVYTASAVVTTANIAISNASHTRVSMTNDITMAETLDDLVMMWSLVKRKFNSTEPTDDKQQEIWVELKRLIKLDIDDELWKLKKHIHNLTWKLYDSCEVQHVSTKKGMDIYILVEKEYPLSRGTLTLMFIAKLLVEQDNKMSKEFLRKIFMQVERPRR